MLEHRRRNKREVECRKKKKDVFGWDTRDTNCHYRRSFECVSLVSPFSSFFLGRAGFWRLANSSRVAWRRRRGFGHRAAVAIGIACRRRLLLAARRVGTRRLRLAAWHMGTRRLRLLLARRSITSRSRLIGNRCLIRIQRRASCCRWLCSGWLVLLLLRVAAGSRLLHGRRRRRR